MTCPEENHTERGGGGGKAGAPWRGGVRMNARRMNLEGEEGWGGETGKVGMKRRRVPEGIEMMGRRGKGKG